ncbi:hypothetical protein [Nocardioides lijunqiniae]|uniref:hypothetical protein n=1 Tax=Nocardioides lijunqiniae TaxID=2760832 RepID=UPI001878CE2A|nr:hypothetical protein [Nocardioides lijunqiniae]
MSIDPTDASSTPRCTATAKGTGQRCKRRPIPGGTVCVKHGGGAPAVRAAAERRQLEAAAGAVLAGMVWNPAAAPVTDNVLEMQRLAGSMRQAVDVLGGRLEDGDPCEECGRGAGADLDSVTGTAWLRVLRELRQLLADMQRLGIAERAVELEADRVRLIAVALGRVFDVLGLDVEQRGVGTRVLLEELRAAAVAGEVAES